VLAGAFASKPDVGDVSQHRHLDETKENIALFPLRYFGCEGAFETYARSCFEGSVGGAALEKKTIAMYVNESLA
jgi:hypothetical protein